MKKLQLFTIIFLIISCNSKKRNALIGETEYQQKLNASYKDGSKSPLKKKDLKNFKGLDFFPVDTAFVTIATLLRTENAPVIAIATNTERTALYKKYGLLNFDLKGKSFELTVYKSQDSLLDDKYKDLLYLPFTDNTSGNESYGAGRYLDIYTTDISKENTVVLNFNNTYNPYCAYNDLFSCPLTPRKNHLDLAVKAGIKIFKKA